MKDLIVSLFSGFFGVVFAGFIIWFFQLKYNEKIEKSKVYIKRVQDDEDKFHVIALDARKGFYNILMILSHSNKDKSIEQMQYIVNESFNKIQYAYDTIQCNPVILGKYNSYLENIDDNYRKFVELYYFESKNEEEEKECGKKMEIFTENIYANFDEIDKLYYFEKTNKKLNNIK